MPEQKIEYLQEQYMEQLDKSITEAVTPELRQALEKEGQKLGLDISFADIKPVESLTENKEALKPKQKKPKL